MNSIVHKYQKPPQIHSYLQWNSLLELLRQILSLLAPDPPRKRGEKCYILILKYSFGESQKILSREGSTCKSQPQIRSRSFTEQQMGKKQVTVQEVVKDEKQIWMKLPLHCFPSLEIFPLPFWLFEILISIHTQSHHFWNIPNWCATFVRTIFCQTTWQVYKVEK